MLKIEIVIDESLIKELQMIFKQAAIQNYTIIEEVKGVGSSGSKFDNATAPGKNLLLFAVVADEQAKNLANAIRRFKATNPSLGIKAIVSDVKEFI